MLFGSGARIYILITASNTIFITQALPSNPLSFWAALSPMSSALSSLEAASTTRTSSSWSFWRWSTRVSLRWARPGHRCSPAASLPVPQFQLTKHLPILLNAPQSPWRQVSICPESPRSPWTHVVLRPSAGCWAQLSDSRPSPPWSQVPSADESPLPIAHSYMTCIPVSWNICQEDTIASITC